MAALLIVTGTGRCGTKYTAQLLGIGHEHTFASDGVHHPMTHDASVVAHRYIDMPFAADWHVIHQVRDPRTCIPSLALGTVFAMQEPDATHWARPYRDWCKKQWPEVFAQPTPQARATWWWWCVNTYTEKHATETIRVEAIGAADVDRWASVLAVDAAPIHQRLADLPTDVNARAPQPPLAWDDLPAEVQVAASRYGYAP
jgi:hypothetical protein